MSAQPMFVALCSACHGADGTGNKMLRRAKPDGRYLALWRLSRDDPETIVNGRNGVMPAHGDLLGENRTKILAAYVYSLSQ